MNKSLNEQYKEMILGENQNKNLNESSLIPWIIGGYALGGLLAHYLPGIIYNLKHNWEKIALKTPIAKGMTKKYLRRVIDETIDKSIEDFKDDEGYMKNIDMFEKLRENLYTWCDRGDLTADEVHQALHLTIVDIHTKLGRPTTFRNGRLHLY